MLIFSSTFFFSVWHFWFDVFVTLTSKSFCKWRCGYWDYGQCFGLGLQCSFPSEWHKTKMKSRPDSASLSAGLSWAASARWTLEKRGTNILMLFLHPRMLIKNPQGSPSLPGSVDKSGPGPAVEAKATLCPFTIMLLCGVFMEYFWFEAVLNTAVHWLALP